jgi:hypothetical protein
MNSATATPENVARKFASILGECLTPEQLFEVIYGDAWPDDFCDGNEAMAEALEHHGVSLWTTRGTMRETSRKLWNASYDVWMLNKATY